ncbi:ABC transporter permease [Thermococcus gammatolerans]|uniref:ABC-2 type transport system permease component, putative n=1 Tax=Thermococcus gammatolerans (strain DSM 15229 / JCM 11827 / EJ3) TaxID=593117 RepID=C5A6L0_THEGJ|nr:ABC transporter permease [Thermococcus gammatolerans]ACS33872.1 ABC-2 type transport system permease component, putative [Thermococcus gammatolerans EJ3]
MPPIFDLFVKEVKLIARRKSILFFLIFIPLFFGAISSSYKSAVPGDTPVAIVLAENVSQDDVWAIMTLARTFSNPHLVPNLTVALNGLQREEYYVVIEVRKFGGLEAGEYVVYYDRTMNPVASISENLIRLLRIELKGARIESAGINDKVSLPMFFLPGILLFISMMVGFELVADNTISEKNVFPRLRLAGVFTENFVVRVIIMPLLVLVQTLLVLIIYHLMNVKVSIDIGVVTILVLNTLLFSLLGLLVTMLLRFEPHAKTFLHVLMGFIIFISGLFYPVGFFPEVLQRIARLTPTYYSAVLMRAFMFRPGGVSLYFDYIAINVISVVLLSIVVLIVHGRALKWSVQ